MMRRALGLIFAGTAGAVVVGTPYYFAYAAGLHWFYQLPTPAPATSELFSLEAFAFYGLCGFPVVIAAGAATGIRLARRRGP
jgi:hypothetical protein